MGDLIKRVEALLNNKQVSFYRVSKDTGIDQAIFSRARAGNGELSSRVIDKLADYFGVSKTWLMTGKGDMLKVPDGKGGGDAATATLSVGRVIPLYDADAAAGSSYGMDMAPARATEMIQIGGFLRESEAALRVYGNSMIPHYPPGCIVALKIWNERFIEPGAVYVVETQENRFLKRLLYNVDKTAFRCVSDNTIRHEDGAAAGELCYPEFEIPVEAVRRLFRVVGVVKRNTI